MSTDYTKILKFDPVNFVEGYKLRNGKMFKVVLLDIHNSICSLRLQLEDGVEWNYNRNGKKLGFEGDESFDIVPSEETAIEDVKDFVWAPWKTYDQDLELLPISEPPCKHCRFFKPVRTHNTDGTFSGVRLCHNESTDGVHDFSCFNNKQK